MQSADRFDALCAAIDKLNFADHDICILIRGAEADKDEAEKAATHIRDCYPGKEVYVVEGLQEIYDYILILE